MDLSFLQLNCNIGVGMIDWSGGGLARRASTGLALMTPLVAAMPMTAARAEEPAFAEHMTGDWGGTRTRLKDKGIEIGVVYTGEALANLSGGLKRGTSFEGLLDVTVESDLGKLVGWRGAKTHIRVFDIHNARGLNAADYVGSLADPSNIDAYATTRLFTAWFQQEFGTAGSIRIGQLAADDEFFGSHTAGGLINGTFGWGNTLAANLTSGGPAYPLATPGVRARLNFSDSFTVLAGLFSGDPAGPDCYRNDPDADPQVCNKHGTTFSLSGGAFWIGEAQYLVNQGEDAKGLATAYKLGAWHHTGSFTDQRFGLDTTGARVSRADPTAVDSLLHDGSWGLYGVMDQMVWRGRESSVSVFLRGGAAPSDRSLVSWYIDGGIGIKGPFPGRHGDMLTLGIAHAHISGNAAALDHDIGFFSSSPFPVRSGETALELSYRVQIAPWWIIQPDIQYIARPGGGDPHPDDAARRIGDAVLIGVRSAVTF